LQHAKISIVDDSESVRSALSRLLKLHGYVPHAFASAEDFLRSDHLSESACLIADVRMPGMSGVDLLEHLVRQGRHIPVIFITAFPEESSRLRAVASGAVCILQKPFDAQVLFDYIDAALNESDIGSTTDGAD
jgi:FixJ family two-component response regulator